MYCNLCKIYKKSKNPKESHIFKKKKLYVFLLFKISVVMNIENI